MRKYISGIFLKLVSAKRLFSSILLGLFVQFYSSYASAEKLSDMFKRWGEEIGAGAHFGLFVISVVGVFTFLFGFTEYKKAKQTNGDKSIATTFIVVGVLMGVGPWIYAAAAESTTGQTYQVSTDYK